MSPFVRGRLNKDYEKRDAYIYSMFIIFFISRTTVQNSVFPLYCSAHFNCAKFWSALVHFYFAITIWTQNTFLVKIWTLLCWRWSEANNVLSTLTMRNIVPLSHSKCILRIFCVKNWYDEVLSIYCENNLEVSKVNRKN